LREPVYPLAKRDGVSVVESLLEVAGHPVRDRDRSAHIEQRRIIDSGLDTIAEFGDGAAVFAVFEPRVIDASR